MGDNLLAHDKALYNGHAVAAVAATTLEIAREAARLVRVEYELLEPVMSLDVRSRQTRRSCTPDMTTQAASRWRT